MSYLTQQTTEIAQAQVTETLLRMKRLGLHENAVKEFHDCGKLNYSERGILYWLDEQEEAMVREWEKKTGNMVYHVIKNRMEFGLCYSFLYVSKYTEEWCEDGDDLKEGCPMVYVKNVDDDWCSEYGRIGIAPRFGGVLRTA